MGSSLVLRLVIGKEASRVDALYLRISLCYKILDGTKLYKDLHKLVDTAAKKLKKELGPLDRRFRNCVRLLLKFTTTLAPSHTSTLSFSTSHQKKKQAASPSQAKNSPVQILKRKEQNSKLTDDTHHANPPAPSRSSKASMVATLGNPPMDKMTMIEVSNDVEVAEQTAFDEDDLLDEGLVKEKQPAPLSSSSVPHLAIAGKLKGMPPSSAILEKGLACEICNSDGFIVDNGNKLLNVEKHANFVKGNAATHLSKLIAGKHHGFVLDPEKCSQLTLVEKWELVHEIAQWPEDAPKILSSFTRRELLEIICAEMERKYTGLAKGRMIDLLLNVVLINKRKQNPNASIAFLLVKSQPRAKRQKRFEYSRTHFLLCENLACRASLGPEDGFCRRCSCCICHAYDDNKDPSLRLTCNSDPPNDGVSRGLSCHLKCALKNERSGLPKNSCY
ncbi:LOW QUALITY PROTEIN: hypothetical protein V2J09_004378 [Rumex salicifolius]